MGEVLLGTSGWSYDEWIGPFYSSKQQNKLFRYSIVFDTVEIDSTFYSYPTESMIKGLIRNVPEGFVFTAKLPRVITHEKMLALERGVKEDMKRFCDIMIGLQREGMLGCLLIQLGPRFTFRPATLRRFFESLPSEFDFAIEFRHLSWMNQHTFDLLKEFNVAYTIVDEPLLPPTIHITSDFAYIRWHGHGKSPWFDYHYSKDELEPWVDKVRVVKDRVRRVYGYFNNHYHGYAVHNCLQMMEMLGLMNEIRYKAKYKIEKYLGSRQVTF